MDANLAAAVTTLMIDRATDGENISPGEGSLALSLAAWFLFFLAASDARAKGQRRFPSWVVYNQVVSSRSRDDVGDYRAIWPLA